MPSISDFNFFIYFLVSQLRFSSVQSLSRVWLIVTPWTAACHASLSITNTWSPPKPMSIELVIPSKHLTLCRPLPLLPSIFPSIRVFSNESALHIRWPKYWSFSFNISPTNEYPGLISLRMDRLILLAVQETLKSLLQHHSSKASVLRHSAFFIVHLSHPNMTTRKTIALTRLNFVEKLMSLLFNMLSRLVITFLPRSRGEEKSLSHVQLFATPWTVAHQTPWSKGFSRHEYWSGLPFPSPGDFPTQGSNSGLLHCRQTLYHPSYQGSQGVSIF